MFLWEPSTSQKPTARMTGHLQLINQVQMPDKTLCKAQEPSEAFSELEHDTNLAPQQPWGAQAVVPYPE